MGLTNEEIETLLLLLERSGWVREGDTICAPCESIWFNQQSPWQGDITDFHSRMVGRLKRIEAFEKHYPRPESDGIIEDTRSLVVALESILAGQ